MILQRASSLSCAATPLPQTFATGRFYRTSSCANPMTCNARETRHAGHPVRHLARPKSQYTSRTRPVHFAMTIVFRVHVIRSTQDHPGGRSSPSKSPLAPGADEDKPHHRGKAQPPRATAAQRNRYKRNSTAQSAAHASPKRHRPSRRGRRIPRAGLMSSTFTC